MSQKRPKYIREERNGKVVYVPVSPDSKQSGSTQSVSQTQPYDMGWVTSTSRQLILTLGRWCDRWFPPVAIIGAAGLTVGLGWLGWQTLTHPDVIFWVNQFIPGDLNQNIPDQDQPKIMDDILAELKEQGIRPDTPIILDADFSFLENLDNATTVAIPNRVERKDSTCPNGCQAIQDIQVYRALELPKLIRLLQRQRRFRKVSSTRIGGPSDEDLNRLIRLLTRSGSNEGNSRSMPLSNIATKNTDDGNRWILLSGVKAKGYATASFGQILHVNSKRTQLNVVVNWLSPSGTAPKWQDLTGDGNTEIIIDQSVEFEPSFAVYVMKEAPNGDPWVKPITFSQTAIAVPSYQNAIKLAKSGLWNQAETQLEAIKSSTENWPPEAENQLKVVSLHAKMLSANESLAFSDPVAEIQSLLIRGEWSQAQGKVLASKPLFEAVQVVLESDNGQIGDRIHTAALVGQNRKAAIDWGIIYHYARGGKAQAESWVNKNHPKAKPQLKAMIKKLTKSPEKEKKKDKSDKSKAKKDS